MRIALLADIHANLPALEAVLADAHSLGVDAWWNLGDMLGYGPHPAEVVNRLIDLENATHILGNYDEKVLRFAGKPNRWPRPKSPAKFFAFQWAWGQLDDDQRTWLGSLTGRRRVEAAGWRALLVHGSLTDAEEGIDATTSPTRLAELADLAKADLVAAGHTHRPLDRSFGAVRFLNPGTIGRSDDGDPRASYAVLDLQEGVCEMQVRRIDYDIDQAVRAVRNRGLPEAFAQMLIQGRELNEVIAAQPIRPHQAAHPRAEDDPRMAGVQALAEACHYEPRHAEHVTYLALRLFDELAGPAGLGGEARFWLEAAGLLHDIGWIEGQQKHHKVSRDLIQAANQLDIDDRSRAIIAAVARYHRKALPSEDHPEFARLQAADRHTVRLLGGMLRIADGLDRTHTDAVTDLAAEIGRSSIKILAETQADAKLEKKAADNKADLLAEALQRKVKIRLAPVRDAYDDESAP